MTYTPPNGSNVNFDLQTYTVLLGSNVNFELGLGELNLELTETSSSVDTASANIINTQFLVELTEISSSTDTVVSSTELLGTFVLGGPGSPIYEFSVEYLDNNEINKADMTIDPGVDLKINQDITIKDITDNIVFEGFIANEKVTEYSLREVQLKTHEGKLQNRIVDDIFTNINIIDFIELIVTTYSDLTFTSDYMSDFVIDKYFSKNKKAWDLVYDAIDTLGDATYRVTDKNFHLFRRGSVFSTLSFENLTNVLIDGGWEQDDENQLTSLTLTGEKFDERTEETFTGDGVTSTFILGRIPKDIRILVDGVEKKLLVQGQVNGDFTLTKRQKTITFLPNKIPPNGSTILVEYTFEELIKVTTEADKEIIEKYGLIEESLTRKFITDTNTAIDYSIEIIEKRQNPRLYTQFEYTQELDLNLFYPGMNIRVKDDFNTIEEETIDQSFNISSIKYSYPDEGIMVGVGELPQKLSYFLKEQNYDLKQLYEQDDNTEILQISQTIQNKIDVEFSTTIEIYERDLPNNYMYLGDKNKSPVYDGFGYRPLRDENGGTQDEFLITDEDDWENELNLL